MLISIIAAVSLNGVIGKDNKLLWRLRKDMLWFKEHTSNHHVLMGRKTFESLKKPLPNRVNMVVSKSFRFEDPKVQIFNNLEEPISFATNNGEGELFVIGGGQIYEEYLPKASKLYLTIVHTEIEGDTYFPFIELENWNILFEEEHEADEKNEYDFTFMILERK